MIAQKEYISHMFVSSSDGTVRAVCIIPDATQADHAAAEARAKELTAELRTLKAAQAATTHGGLLR